MIYESDAILSEIFSERYVGSVAGLNALVFGVEPDAHPPSVGTYGTHVALPTCRVE